MRAEWCGGAGGRAAAPVPDDSPARPGVQNGAVTRRSTEDTRLALLRAAEQLFAERGVDAVSLREVSAAAGQANNSAVAYHFGSRELLVDAILERHSTPVQERYVAQLDALERHGVVTTRAAVEIMALPIIAKLDDPDGGAAYISLCAQLSVSPTLPLVARPAANTPQVIRLMRAMWSARTVPAELEAFRMERLAATLYTSIGMWHRLVREGAAPVAREVFESELIDALVDIIERPASARTLAALAAQAQPSQATAGARPRAKRTARRTTKGRAR